LTAEDLKDLGVRIGYRRKLLNAIATLCADANAKVPAPEALGGFIADPGRPSNFTRIANGSP